MHRLPALAAPDKGDTAFLMLSTVLVLLMTIPGLALFYCGLVRTKNAISMLMQVFAIVCIVCVIWMLYGYSLTFTNGGQFNDWIGGFSKAFLRGVTPGSEAATFSNGVYVPEYAYIWFQMTFAAITPALIVGAFAERMKFSALIVFMVLWVTFVYFPIAHMVWYWAGPDAIADAAREVAQATGLAKIDAQNHLDMVHARRRPGLPMGRHRLRRRHGRAHQCRHRRARRRADPRAPRRLRPRADAAAFPDAGDGRRLAPVGRMVRLQLRLEPRSERHGRARHGQHVRRHGDGGARLDVRRVG